MRRGTETHRRTRHGLAVLALLGLGIVLALPGAGLTHGYKLGSIAIGHVWAPPAAQAAEGIPVYGPILNRGAEPQRLVGVSSPIAREAGFRIVEDGTPRMLSAIDLPPGRPLSLAPWRAHIWLTGLDRSPDKGESFDLVLDFGDAGSLTVEVMVESDAGH